MIFRMRALRRRARSSSPALPGPPPQPVAAPVQAAPAPIPVTRNLDGIEVPWSLRVSAAWSWRLLIVAAATALVIWIAVHLAVVLVPVILGLLISAVAVPAADRLVRWGVPRGIATAIVVVGGIVVLTGLITLIAQQVTSGFDDLRKSFAESTDRLQEWLADLGVSAAQMSDFFDQLKEGITAGEKTLGESALAATSTAGHVVAGLFLVLFTVIFFVYDGRGIWKWIVGLLPPAAREAADGSGRRAWSVLTSYVRATVIIAAVDAIGISLVALLLDLPLVLPIAVLVFLGAFIPIVGALVSGAAAVAVALVTQSPVAALLMLAGVLAVQQVESHVLQPFLMGRMVRVHPFAVVLVIAIGSLIAGIFGALISVPLAAVINTVGLYLSGQHAEHQHVAEAGAATDLADGRP